MTDPLPLKGHLVLDLSQGIAGPSCGMALAELGARVIKVEPPTGDWMRPLGAGVDGTSAFALHYNRGKESLVLDLKSPEGQEAARRIAAKADVLIESGRPGVTEGMGLGFDRLAGINPGLIYLTISGYGLSGPRARDPLVDTYAQAFSGMMSINRDASGTPVKFGQPLIDAVTGLYAVQSILAALFPTGEPRRARRLDVSLTQSAAALMAPKIIEHVLTGGAPVGLNPPAGIYLASDRYLTFTLVREADWGKICRGLGKPEWIEDPRFATFASRHQNLAELRALISDLVATRTAEAWAADLTAQGVMAGPVNDFGDWLKEPQVKTMDAAPLTDFGGASLPVPRTPSRQPFEAAPPKIGAHTRSLAQEFGLDLPTETP